jgi:hypothetical protein
MFFQHIHKFFLNPQAGRYDFRCVPWQKPAIILPRSNTSERVFTDLEVSRKHLT